MAACSMADIRGERLPGEHIDTMTLFGRAVLLKLTSFKLCPADDSDVQGNLDLPQRRNQANIVSIFLKS